MRIVQRGPCDKVTVRQQSHVAVPPRDSIEEGRRVTEARIDQIALAAAWYCQSHAGSVATTESQLLEFAESERSQGRSKCLLAPQLLVDAWGGVLQTTWRGKNVEVSSFGPDGKAGTGDEIGLLEQGAEGSEDIDVRTACESPR